MSASAPIAAAAVPAVAALGPCSDSERGGGEALITTTGYDLHRSQLEESILRLRSLEGLEHSPFLRYRSLKLAALKSRLCTSRTTGSSEEPEVHHEGDPGTQNEITAKYLLQRAERLPRLPLVLVTGIGVGFNPVLSARSCYSSTTSESHEGSSTGLFVDFSRFGRTSNPDSVTLRTAQNWAPSWNIKECWVQAKPRDRRRKVRQVVLMSIIDTVNSLQRWLAAALVIHQDCFQNGKEGLPPSEEIHTDLVSSEGLLSIPSRTLALNPTVSVEETMTLSDLNILPSNLSIDILSTPCLNASMQELSAAPAFEQSHSWAVGDEGKDHRHKVLKPIKMRGCPTARKRDESLERLKYHAVQLKRNLEDDISRRSLEKIARKESLALYRAQTSSRQNLQRSWLTAISSGLLLEHLNTKGYDLGEARQQKKRLAEVTRAAEIIQKKWRSYYVWVFMMRNHARLLPIITLSKRWQLRIRVRRKKKFQPILLFVLKEAMLSSKVEGALVKFRQRYHCIQNAARSFIFCRRARLVALLKLWVKEESRVKNAIITGERCKADAELRATSTRLGKEFENLPDARWIPQLTRKLQVREKETAQNLFKAHLLAKKMRSNYEVEAEAEAEEKEEGKERTNRESSILSTMDKGPPVVGATSTNVGVSISVEGPRWRRRIQEFCEHQPECLVPVGARIRACEQFLRTRRIKWKSLQEGSEERRSRVSVSLVQTLLHQSDEALITAMKEANKSRPPEALQIFTNQGRKDYLYELEESVRSVLRDKQRW